MIIDWSRKDSFILLILTGVVIVLDGWVVNIIKAVFRGVTSL